MSKKIKGIVIKSNDKKEKDKNILLFSIEDGKIWATLKGVKSPKAKMKLAQNSFCFGEFVLEEGKSGFVVVGFEVFETFHEIGENIDKFFEASSILEAIRCLEFSSEKERAEVFVLTLTALKSICFGTVHNLYVLDKFFLKLFDLSGFPLYTPKCRGCATVAFDNLYIDFQSGELLCAGCKNFSCQELSKTTYLALKFLNNTDFDRLKTLKLAQDSEFDLLKLLVKNFERRFDKKLNLIGILS